MHRLCVVLVLAIPALGSAQSGAAPDRTSRVAWLQANAIPVRSVDPADTDFADLAPFGKAIGNARIVMLGEQSHGDGTVFLAKTRLIRYLHEVLGFDVLAVESGIYDMQKVWELLRNGEAPVSAFRHGMSGIWTGSAQFVPLMDYVGSRAATSRPLELSGFDSQTHASSSGDFWVSDLLTFLYTHNVALPSNWAAGRPVLDSLINFLYVRNPASPAQQQALFAALDSIIARVASLPTADRTTAFWQQNLKSFRGHASRNVASNPDPKAFKPTDNNGRDAQMAENLLWLAQKRYPDRKIIVWAATFHNIRNPGIIGDSGAYLGLRTMGHIAWEALGTQIYSLGFVASEGKKGTYFARPSDVPTPDSQSLEGLLASTKHKLAIVDFKHLPAGVHWLRERLVSGPLGYSPQKADWTQILDGVMYTRTMLPSTRDPLIK